MFRNLHVVYYRYRNIIFKKPLLHARMLYTINWGTILLLFLLLTYYELASFDN